MNDFKYCKECVHGFIWDEVWDLVWDQVCEINSISHLWQITDDGIWIPLSDQLPLITEDRVWEYDI